VRAARARPAARFRRAGEIPLAPVFREGHWRDSR
jgi:hypothetical protein